MDGAGGDAEGRVDLGRGQVARRGQQQDVPLPAVQGCWTLAAGVVPS
ncbi:hypothetical protein ACFFWA_25630 [Actinomadura verrucosospora]